MIGIPGGHVVQFSVSGRARVNSRKVQAGTDNERYLQSANLSRLGRPSALHCIRWRRMHREFVRWYSPSLHRDMELLAFGHGGFPVLVFPTSHGRFWEYEERGMLGSLAPKIER